MANLLTEHAITQTPGKLIDIAQPMTYRIYTYFNSIPFQLNNAKHHQCNPVNLD